MYGVLVVVIEKLRVVGCRFWGNAQQNTITVYAAVIHYQLFWPI